MDAKLWPPSISKSLPDASKRQLCFASMCLLAEFDGCGKSWNRSPLDAEDWPYLNVQWTSHCQFLTLKLEWIKNSEHQFQVITITYSHPIIGFIDDHTGFPKALHHTCLLILFVLHVLLKSPWSHLIGELFGYLSVSLGLWEGGMVEEKDWYKIMQPS